MGGPSGSDPGVGAHPGEKGPSATTARVTKKLLATFICLLQRELEVSPAAHGARLAEANSKRWVGECVRSSGWVVCPRGLLALPTCQLHGACAVLGETSGGRWEHWRRRGQGKGWRRARVKRARAAPEGRGAAVRQGGCARRAFRWRWKLATHGALEAARPGEGTGPSCSEAARPGSGIASRSGEVCSTRLGHSSELLGGCSARLRHRSELGRSLRGQGRAQLRADGSLLDEGRAWVGAARRLRDVAEAQLIAGTALAAAGDAGAVLHVGPRPRHFAR
jgi:hypothetical protein